MKPAGAFDDQLDAVLRRGRRDQIDVAQAGLAHQRFVVAAFLGRQIEHQQTVHTRLGRVPDEPLHAVAMDQVEINVEHDGNLRLLADGGHGFQDFGRRGAGFQAALGRELIDQAIRQRIAERHAQFQHIHAELIERQRQLSRGVEVRIARADVNDEPFWPSRLRRANRSTIRFMSGDTPVGGYGLQGASWTAGD